MTKILPETKAGEEGYLHTYLGDGAYLVLDNFGDVVIYTHDGVRTKNRVVLGSFEIAILEGWLSELPDAIQEIRKANQTVPAPTTEAADDG